MNIETKVGIFVILGSVLIAILSIVFGKIDLTSNDGKNVYFKIENATGIRKGTPIMYKGIKVGEVENVAFTGQDLTAQVTIFKDYEIPDNVKFIVKQSGFVGQKFVEFEVDNKVPAKGSLQHNAEYDGKQNSGADMDAVMAKFGVIADEMTLLLRSINDVVTTDNSQMALKDTIENLRGITESINKLITSNDAKFDEVIDNARRMTAVLDRLLVKNEKSINESIGNINELTTSLKSLSASVDKLIANNSDNIDYSLSNLKEITDKVNSTMDNIGNITKDINEGNGALGMLINDNETKQDLKRVVKGMSSFFGSDDNSTDSGFKLYGTVGADYLFDGKSVNTGRGYAGVTLYTDPKNFYTLGVSNIPTISPNSPEFDIYGNRMKNSELAFSLQYSHIFYNVFGLRFGIFDNTLGLATDFYPLQNNNLAISLEAYDFNAYKDRFDVYTRAYIRWHFYKGFFIQGGVEDILGNTNRMYMVGAGVRFLPSELKKLANNTEKNDLVKTSSEENVEETTKTINSPVIEKQIEVKNNKKEENHDDDFFDSLVY